MWMNGKIILFLSRWGVTLEPAKVYAGVVLKAHPGRRTFVGVALVWLNSLPKKVKCGVESKPIMTSIMGMNHLPSILGFGYHGFDPQPYRDWWCTHQSILYTGEEPQRATACSDVCVWHGVPGFGDLTYVHDFRPSNEANSISFPVGTCRYYIPICPPWYSLQSTMCTPYLWSQKGHIWVISGPRQPLHHHHRGRVAWPRERSPDPEIWPSKFGVLNLPKCEDQRLSMLW